MNPSEEQKGTHVPPTGETSTGNVPAEHTPSEPAVQSADSVDSYDDGYPHEPEVEGLKAYRSVLDVTGPIDMASFYVPPEIGERVIGEVARKRIPEVWLNPGAESDALIARARSLDIKPIVACSIVAIGRNPYSF